MPWLRQVSVLGVRSGSGPQGVPINHSAVYRGVVAAATSPAYRLTVVYGDRQARLSLADLRAMPQTTASLPIACVEGWSAGATWTGVPVRDLLDLVGAPAGSEVLVESLQEHGGERLSTLAGQLLRPPAHAAGARRSTASRCRSTTASRAG